MAVGFRAAGSWENGSTGLTADEVVAVPAAQVTGDMMLLIGVWKQWDTTAQVSGWSELFELADGTVNASANAGSVKVGVWYKVATSDTESDPTLDFSVAPAPGEATILVFSKGAGTVWATPTYVVGDWPSSADQTINADATIDVPSGGAVVAVLGIRDDSATFTRSTTSLAAVSGVTWNGDATQQPATHASTTTSNDISCSAVYRLVTTGGTAVTLQQTAVLSATETGQGAWIVLGEAVNPSGTGAVTTAATTVSGTGSHVANPAGTGAVTTAATTVSGTGAEVFTATGAMTHPATTVSGTAAELFTATGAVTTAATTVAGTGEEAIAATGDATLPAATVSGTGDHTGGATTGTGEVTLPAATVAGTGSLELTGTGAVSLAALTASGTGALVITGSGAIAISTTAVASDGLHIQNAAGTGAITLPSATASGTGSGGAADGRGGRVAVPPIRGQLLAEDEQLLADLPFGDF